MAIGVNLPWNSVHSTGAADLGPVPGRARRVYSEPLPATNATPPGPAPAPITPLAALKEPALQRQDSFDTLVKDRTGLSAPPPMEPSVSPRKAILAARWLEDAPDTVQAQNGRRYICPGMVLGHGALGQVELALDVKSQQLVAIKRINCYDENDPAKRRDALSEVAALIATNSPMAPLQVLDTEAELLLILPLMSHTMQPNRQWRALPPATRAGLAWLSLEGTLPALAALHRRNLAHRDYKPANVLHRSSRVELIDYDFVCEAQSDRYLTSFPYAGPECCGLTPGAGIDLLDLWCVGATALEQAGGRAAGQLLAHFDEEAEVFAHYGDFPGWRQLYQRLYPQLLSNKPPRHPNPCEQLVFAAFADIPTPLRQLILAWMHPNPTARCPLTAAAAALAAPEMRQACDIEGATAFLRRRAGAQMNTVATFIKPLQNSGIAGSQPTP